MKRIIIGILVIVIYLSGCNQESTNTEKKLTIYSPHPLEFIDPIIGEYENNTGITVKVISAGTGELLSRIESEKNEPVADVLWGGSLSILENHLYLFEPYLSDNEEAALYKNEDGYITRFTLVPSIIMINENLLGDIEIKGFKDLLNPALQGKIAFADPSKSSSSYEHLINQLMVMGKDDIEAGWEYVRKLNTTMNGKILDNSRDVYRGVAEGEYYVGLTFEDPAAQYIQSGVPIKIVYPSEGTIVRPDGIAIISDSNRMEEAKDFIDFLTSYEIQTYIASELNRRSIRNDVSPAKGLATFDKMSTMDIDSQWSVEEREAILKKYFRLLEMINTETGEVIN